jgi:hypothetical protein
VFLLKNLRFFEVFKFAGVCFALAPLLKGKEAFSCSSDERLEENA